MPIRIVKVGELYCPMAVCDHCGQPVSDAHDGNALYLEKRVGTGWAVDDRIFITHKKCNSTFERSHSEQFRIELMTEELDVFIARLVQNLGITLDGAKRTKRKMDLLEGLS